MRLGYSINIGLEQRSTAKLTNLCLLDFLSLPLDISTAHSRYHKLHGTIIFASR